MSFIRCDQVSSSTPRPLPCSVNDVLSVQNGNTALGIARRLGYISVVDTLRVVTEEIITTTTVGWITGL